MLNGPTTLPMKRTILATALFALTMGVTACYPRSFDSIEETDLVLTVRDPEGSIQGKQTFSLPDTVPELCGNEEKCEDDTYDHKFADPIILGRIRKNLEDLGYTYTDDEESADLYIPVGAVVSTNYFVYYYYDWWGYWGWYPGGGGWWWWYYPVQGVTVYKTGTIIFGMVKRSDIGPPESTQGPDDEQPAKATDGEQRVRPLWTAAINGLAGSSATLTKQRIENTIDQAFSQSPYLAGSQ